MFCVVVFCLGFLVFWFYFWVVVSVEEFACCFFSFPFDEVVNGEIACDRDRSSYYETSYP